MDYQIIQLFVFWKLHLTPLNFHHFCSVPPRLYKKKYIFSIKKEEVSTERGIFPSQNKTNSRICSAILSNLAEEDLPA
jgi:hypothetical protein